MKLRPLKMYPADKSPVSLSIFIDTAKFHLAFHLKGELESLLQPQEGFGLQFQAIVDRKLDIMQLSCHTVFHQKSQMIQKLLDALTCPERRQMIEIAS
jgi:hypothetical protein